MKVGTWSSRLCCIMEIVLYFVTVFQIFTKNCTMELLQYDFSTVFNAEKLQ